MKPVLGILMGSRADLGHAAKIAEAAESLGMAVRMRIASAHKTPLAALDILKGWESDAGVVAIVTVAGRSNALSGFADAQVSLPVIACPPPSDAFGGADLFSSLRMPSGVAPMLVLDPANAALAAAKIAGTAYPEIRRGIDEIRRMQAEKIAADDAGLSRTESSPEGSR